MINRTHRARRFARRRRLAIESLVKRELFAIGDFCYAIEFEPAAAVAEEPEAQSDASLSVSDATIVEGEAGVTELAFSVTLSAAPTAPVTVDIGTVDDTATALGVRRVNNSLSRPVYATSPAGDFDRLFVVEQRGDIEILQLPSGQKNGSPFLRIGGLATGNEQGLLGLAFHPNYEQNGKFYIYVTVSGGDTEVREYKRSADDPDRADSLSARTILTFDQPFSNHNAGWIDFGPDGYLYVASGDGGSGNDPQGNAQDITNNLLGKMLRIDVDGDDFPADGKRNYAIPPSNPFVGVTGDDEIWAYGLRNPWRNSFDRETGDLYIADVGQNVWEEINVQPGSSVGGENYGWRLREGTNETPANNVGGPRPAGAIDPIYEYRHSNLPTGGYSVSGGYVYRGPIEELQGNYFFADYVTNRVWSLRFNGDAPNQHDGTNYTDFVDWTPLLRPDFGTVGRISSFGEDAAGNLYILDLTGGEIFTIENGADYLPQSDTLEFDVGAPLTQTFTVEVLGDRLFETDETFRVVLSNQVGATIDIGTAVGTIQNDDPQPPSVESVVINDGTSGRSQITSVTVTFDTVVNAPDSAFRLTNTDTAAVLDGVQIERAVVDSRTVAVLTFDGGVSVVDRDGTAELGDSLINGNYRLDVIATEVTSVADAVAMGGDYEFGSNAADNFFRLYGDDDGNRTVDLFDFAAFRATFGLGSSAPAFDNGLDENGDGVVDLFDFAAFRGGFGTGI